MPIHDDHARMDEEYDFNILSGRRVSAQTTKNTWIFKSAPG